MHAGRRSLARRRTKVDRRAKILCVQPSGRYQPQDARRHDQSQMGLRAGASAVEGRTRPRPLRRQILDRTTPARLDDHDRLRLPPVPPPQGRGTEKKESGARRHNRACRPSGKPSLTSSCALRAGDVPTAPNSSTKLPRPICQSSASRGTQITRTSNAEPLSEPAGRFVSKRRILTVHIKDDNVRELELRRSLENQGNCPTFY